MPKLISPLSPHIDEPSTPPVQAERRSLDEIKLSATKTHLFPLPAELNLKILNHVAVGSGFETHKNMKTLPNINKASRLLLTEDKKLFSQYRSLKALVPRANNIPDSEFAIFGSSKILDLLSPKKRTAIVDFALANESPDIEQA